jgi:hypothetical protein
MIRFVAWALAALLPAAASAQMSPDSPMVQALREGRASAPVPQSEGAQLIVRKIKEASDSQGEVSIEFFRITRFVSQATCGRVGYGLYQQSSNTFWGQFGGQMNICDDGTAPQRECKGQPGLVLPDAKCEDGSVPIDTAEVKAAIEKAVADGSMTAEQFKVKFNAELKSRMGQK